jgi:hypothetical protein
MAPVRFIASAFKRIARTIGRTLSSPLFCLGLALVLVGDAWVVVMEAGRNQFHSTFAQLIDPVPAGHGLPTFKALFLVEQQGGPALIDQMQWYVVTENDPLASPIILSNVSLSTVYEPSGFYRPMGTMREFWVLEQPAQPGDTTSNLTDELLREIIEDHIPPQVAGGPLGDPIADTFDTTAVFRRNASGDFAASARHFEPDTAGVALNLAVLFGWLVLLVSAVASPIGTVRRYRRRRGKRWAKRGRCAACGYDLRGTNEPRCPECGLATPSRGDAQNAAPPGRNPTAAPTD